MKKNALFLILTIATLLVVTSCRGHKDCQGNRHRVKTEMGGWL